tara:strand:- start:10 stop:546 length:537 start_codon:yes stop_codon:yes gene_type:complete
VSSLITSVAANTSKTYHHDNKAHEHATAASSVGFGGIGLLIGFLLFHKMYLNVNRPFVYSLVWMCVVLTALSALTYLTYDRLVKSKYHPVGAVNNLNNTELNLAFSAFCLSIVGISVGLTYVITAGIHEGYFDNLSGNIFEIKRFFEGFFEESPNGSKKASETIEMDNLLSDLIETSF